MHGTCRGADAVSRMDVGAQAHKQQSVGRNNIVHRRVSYAQNQSSRVLARCHTGTGPSQTGIRKTTAVRQKDMKGGYTMSAHSQHNGPRRTKRQHAIAIAVYSFFLVSLSLLLMGVSRATALIGFNW